MKHLSDNNFNSNKLENVPTPVNGGDAVNKAYADTKQSINTNITDAIQEWWIYPSSTYLESPVRRTVSGSISSTGMIVASEVNHDNGLTKRVEVAQAIVDDHNAPSLWAEAGRRMIVAWTNHSSDNILRFKVSDASGSIESLGTATEQTWTASSGTSYTQIHKIHHLSDASNDVFWVFSRISYTSWWYIPITVSQSTGNITFGTARQLFTAAGQTYITTAPAYGSGNQKIRLAWGYNPASGISRVFYAEIDCVTGAITTPADGTVGNMSGSSLPISDTSVTAVLNNLPAGNSRRLFYVRSGPILPAIAYADWNNASPSEAEYRVIEATTINAGTWNQYSYGKSGAKIGYTDGANYIAGMAFPNPATDNTVYIARENNGRSTLEVHTIDGAVHTKQVVAEDSSGRIARPMPVINAGPIQAHYSHVTHYGSSFTDYYADLKSTENRPIAVGIAGGGEGYWQDWAPTFLGFSIGNGTINYAKYSQVGKTVFFRLKVTMGSTSNVTSRFIFVAPVPMLYGPGGYDATNDVIDGTVLIHDTGSTIYTASLRSESWASYIGLWSNVASTSTTTLASTGATHPMTWTTGDAFIVAGTYEAA